MAIVKLNNDLKELYVQEQDDIRQELRKASVIENTAKMNAEQTKTRMEEAKQSCAGSVSYTHLKKKRKIFLASTDFLVDI